VTSRPEVVGERGEADRPGHEPREPIRALPSEQQHDETGSAERAGDACELRAHAPASTNTTDFAVWPFAVTTSR